MGFEFFAPAGTLEKKPPHGATCNRCGLCCVATLPKGEPMTLVREPTNKHDPNAVQVWARGVHVGYVRGTQARGLALAMDRLPKLHSPDTRETLVGTLTHSGDHWLLIEVER